MPNTSDIIFDTLERWGVDTVFGLPGDGINGLMEALRTRSDRIKFVLVRHEESAAFMATGYAKFTGRLGVCLATSGPGGIHLLNGLYDAKLDIQPVLAITGQTFTDLIGSRYQQEVNMLQAYSDVALYNVQVNSPEHARLATDLACRTAIGKRGVAHLNIPIDVQMKDFTGDYSEKAVPQITSQAPLDLGLRPPGRELERAAEILNTAARPVILAGQGARDGRRELIQLAERLNAPIVKPLLGKDVVPDDHPLCMGGIGLLGTLPSEEALEQCDALLMVGTSFPYIDYLPKPGAARGIQVDIDASRIGMRYPVEVGLVGDSKATLTELLPLVRRREPNGWIEGLQNKRADWLALMESRAMRDDMPLKPQRLAWELGKRLRDDAIITSDAGTIATWVARYVKIKENQRFSLSGTLATMAPGLPYAIAAQVAHPDRQVVAFIGDGGLLMLGSELSTAAHYKLPIKVVVVKNNILGMIKWEQLVFLGNPSYGVQLPEVDLVKFAESMGVRGIHLERPDEVGSVLDEALAHDGPCLVEAVVDPNEPPRPAKVEVKQALHLAKALAKGEPNATKIGLTLFRGKLHDLLHPRP